MTIDVDALIRYLGKSYDDLIDSRLISYKSKPSASSGDEIMNLSMAREGINLYFYREGRILKEISLLIQNDNVSNWVFPNELPPPLLVSMSREWVHATLGQPVKTAPPKVVGRISLGWTERFSLSGYHVPIAMQIRYDFEGMVKKVTFLPVTELRW